MCLAYRIVTCYGKEYIAESIDFDILKSYDTTNLDHLNYYIEMMSEQDERISGKKVQKICQQELFKSLQCSRIPIVVGKNIDERIQLYLHYPLSIFKSKKDLRNVRIVSSVINQYPLILDTILKIQYQNLIGVDRVAQICINTNQYPKYRLNKEIVNELWNNTSSRKQFMYQSIVDDESVFFKMAFYEGRVYGCSYSEDVKLLLPYLNQFMSNRKNVKSLIEMTKCDFELNQIIGICKYYDVLDQGLWTMIQKKREEFLAGSEKDKQYVLEIDELPESDERVLEIDISRRIDEAVDKDGVKQFKKWLFENNAQKYLENKALLLVMAKKGVAMSNYSLLFKDDEEVVLEEIKHGDYSSVYAGSSVFCKRKFILKARYYFSKLLFYIDPGILNDYSFMIKYLKHYSSSEYFILGEKLVDNWNFFEEAMRYDNDILAFASNRIRNTPWMMKKAFDINPNCNVYYAKRLKNFHFMREIFI